MLGTWNVFLSKKKIIVVCVVLCCGNCQLMEIPCEGHVKLCSITLPLSDIIIMNGTYHLYVSLISVIIKLFKEPNDPCFSFFFFSLFIKNLLLGLWYY